MFVKFNNLKITDPDLKKNINKNLNKIFKDTDFINGKEILKLEKKLKKILNVKNVITCGNGTDALQIAIMSLNLKKNDEVIIPAFSYVSALEVVCLLGLRPILVDVNYSDFNISYDQITKAITKKTKLIIPVHLFGQNTEMKQILNLAKRKKIYVIEDSAQTINTNYYFPMGKAMKSGTMGDIGCVSFFPTKNLGCFGDGGAIFTNNNKLAKKIKMIKNHGQLKKYQYEYIGMNSRLDTIQAAILNNKLKYLKSENNKRKANAKLYNAGLININDIIIPKQNKYSEHTYHQYTIKVLNNKRDFLKEYLFKNKIETKIYYPDPLNSQKAFKNIIKETGNLNNSKKLCKQVLSLPINRNVSKSKIIYIIKKIKEFFND